MKNEVIVIEEAYYGRRQIGKCIDAQEAADFAHDTRGLGCFADVIKPLNARCSGKRQCEVRVPDAELEATRQCRKGLHMFLEVSYSCVAGELTSVIIHILRFTIVLLIHPGDTGHVI
jgi:hypothetical protein